LQTTTQKNALTKGLQEYGKLNETIFILKYLQEPEYQKKITIQLNKGEALHALRRNIFIANKGKIRHRTQVDQLNQAMCLNLVVNAITVRNTVYMQAAIEQLKSGGYGVKDEDIKELSPARSEHINLYGKYYFNVEEGLKRVTGIEKAGKQSSLEVGLSSFKQDSKILSICHRFPSYAKSVKHGFSPITAIMYILGFTV
jgi:hypothetical protein